MIDKNFKIEGTCNAIFKGVSNTKFPGHIHFNYQTGGTISISSKSFNKILDQRDLILKQSIKIISGILNNGKKYTILNPFLAKRTVSGGIYTLVFTFKYLLEDSSFSSIESISCRKISFKISGLNNYLYTGKIEFNRENKSVQIISTLPEDKTFQIDDNLSVSFSWLHIVNTKMEGLSKTISKDVIVELILTKKAPLRHLLSICEKIEVFFSILFNQKVVTYDYTSVAFIQSKFKIYSQQSDLDNRLSQLRFHENILELKNTPDILESILSKYLKRFDDLRDIYLIIYDNLNNTGQFSTNQFLNVAQALEAYHRILFDKTKIPSEDFKPLVKRIKNTLEKSDYTFISNNIAFSNQINLKERLDNLLEIYGGDFLEHIGFDDEFCKKIKNTRNLHTHLSDKKKSQIFENDIIHATIKINITLIFFILHYLGVETNFLNQSMIRFWQRRYYFITDI
ncbi:HEPN domain-containing protein [Sphingobacterium multivorum]|uniref:HEPN domain-containing protein n=1 Tax=Sphingobacterium TaxID=28453 RepID=UPI00257D2378|nr:MULTISPECIES: HEPN domain-containing protein [Sphingobacterium]